ncbi:hypothetical protein GGR56DRAFT_205963 [Xylariaceae sp. FL0804]|nr:hypothetical protein GGR56DRAFT_205963 [Xylariaceae sp. FL0804]
MSDLSRVAYVGVGTVFIVICAAFVTLRLIVALRQHGKLFADDYFSLFGLALIITTFALNDIIIREFTHVTDLVWIIQMGMVILVLINLTLWACKAPILFLYARIFGVRRWLRWTSYATLAFSALGLLLSLVPTFARCHPYETPLTAEALVVCTSGTTLTAVIAGFIALAADLVALVLPMPAIRDLHLPTGRKAGLAVVFLSGILGIAASVVSLYYKFQIYLYGTSGTLITMLMSVIECTVAIIVGCAPATKAFWSLYVSKNASVKKYASYGQYGQYGNSKVPRSHGLNASQPPARGVGESYIRMDSVRHSDSSLLGPEHAKIGVARGSSMEHV